jgi:hypothetical protein
VQQDFLEGPRLVQYTREAVRSFLKQLPGLWMFGFRVGESGQPEDFYQKTYLTALAELPPSQNIYLRTWIADPQKVRELAASSKNHIYIEPKYNGEHLGLPYQAALGGREYAPSGSYENYSDKPQNFSIIWQIRAHGTHRVFHWGSPEFARRTVRSCKFGDGVGFSMEPMEAYMPGADYLHNNPNTDHRFYKWMVERQWIWHLIWGRTAYDPDVPDQVFVEAFSQHFGAQAGPLVFQAVAESSKIVPSCIRITTSAWTIRISRPSLRMVITHSGHERACGKATASFLMAAIAMTSCASTRSIAPRCHRRPFM